jgi:hypothetical protein
MIDVWLGMDLKKTPKKWVFNRDRLRAQNLLAILVSIVNIIGGGGTYMIIQENIYFDTV